jgi:hypothetical protein
MTGDLSVSGFLRYSRFLFVAFLNKDFIMTEQQRDTPDTGQSHDGKNDSADDRGLSAEYPADDIKLE